MLSSGRKYIFEKVTFTISDWEFVKCMRKMDRCKFKNISSTKFKDFISLIEPMMIKTAKSKNTYIVIFWSSFLRIEHGIAVLAACLERIRPQLISFICLKMYESNNFLMISSFSLYQRRRK